MSVGRAPALLQLAPRLERDEIGIGTLLLARHARARGWRSFVASGGGPLLRELAAAGATHLPLPLDVDGRLTRWRNADRIARALAEHRIDLVHAQAIGPALPGADAARAAGVALVVTVRDPESVAPRRGLRAVTAAARVVAVSEYAKEEAVARGVPAERVRVVRPGVDPAEFDPERVRGHRVLDLAERWQVPAEPGVILVPPLAPGDRGHLLLLRAMARVARSDWIALLLGEIDEREGYRRELMALMGRLGLAERVRFGGAVDDLPAALALAGLVVLPCTRPDPAGTLAAAAQAMGRPVIVTSRGALAEAVMPAATGWLVPPDDPAELARALELALGMDEATRRRLAARARTFVAAEFGVERGCDRILALFQEVLSPPLARTG